jgi:transcriptional regulator with XRE-family HTH domain
VVCCAGRQRHAAAPARDGRVRVLTGSPLSAYVGARPSHALDTVEAMTNQWGTWLGQISENARGSDIAKRLRVSESKVSYWRRGERPPTPAESVSVARAYGRSPLEGLVAGGYLDAEELAQVAGVVVRTDIADFSAEELAAELVRRATRS